MSSLTAFSSIPATVNVQYAYDYYKKGRFSAQKGLFFESFLRGGIRVKTIGNLHQQRTPHPRPIPKGMLTRFHPGKASRTLGWRGEQKAQVGVEGRKDDGGDSE